MGITIDTTRKVTKRERFSSEDSKKVPELNFTSLVMNRQSRLNIKLQILYNFKVEVVDE